MLRLALLVWWVRSFVHVSEDQDLRMVQIMCFCKLRGSQ